MEKAALIGISRHRIATDGKGVTTLVAFHGCPLRCEYCLNPQCLIKEDKWKLYDCELLYKEVRIDELYFLATGGGIVFGGGEPCQQSDFITDFRELCGSQWQISVETSLNVPRKHLEKLLPIIDHYIIDIKDIDKERYLRYTKKGNEQVINNLEWLIAQGKSEQMIIRVPLIPLYNTEANVEKSIHQLEKMGVTHFDRLTYRT